jgi:ATP-binding cassette subfamily B protein
MLARSSGLGSFQPPDPGCQVASSGIECLGSYLEAAADSGTLLEVEPIHATYNDLRNVVKNAGPAIVALPGTQPVRFLLLLRACRGDQVFVIGTDFRRHRMAVSEVVAVLAAPLEKESKPWVMDMLLAASVPPERVARARVAILRDLLGQQTIGGVWQLRRRPGVSIWKQLWQARLAPYGAGLVGAYFAEYVLFCLAWYWIGLCALQGRRDSGWLFAWALALFSMVVFQMAAGWCQGVLAYGIGARLKRRLMDGALRLHPDETRREGLGHFLGRVFESEAVESLALGAGFTGLLAVVELSLAAVFLPAGASGGAAVVALVVWTGLVILGCWVYARRRRAWNADRLAHTHALLECMVGHQTRLIQLTPETWHEGEDQALCSYDDRAREMDSMLSWLLVLAPRGWLVVGLACLVPAFTAGSAGAAALAVALGATLLAQRGLAHLVDGIANAIDALICWERIGPLYRASSAASQPSAHPDLAVTCDEIAEARGPEAGVLEARELSYRYPSRSDRSLDRCSLTIASGDRILVEGRSGAGKSTLASLLAGLRNPDSGLLLLDGLDRLTLGERGWGRRVATVPQSQENHVINDTFAFNLLLGSRWPPSGEDLARAEAVCQQLGLGDLLERMPAGLMQVVGETGWQLSHGERSRLFVARALLQRPQLLVIDESFTALDPDNLRRCMQAVTEGNHALLVIAHP